MSPGAQCTIYYVRPAVQPLPRRNIDGFAFARRAPLVQVVPRPPSAPKMFSDVIVSKGVTPRRPPVKLSPSDFRRPNNAIKPSVVVVKPAKPKAALPRQQKSRLLMRTAVNKPVPVLKKRHRKLHAALTLVAVSMIGFGIYLTLSGWHANLIAKVQAAKLTAQANAGQGSTQDSSAPSTTKPSAGAVAGYYVGPAFPRYINIPKLAVHTRVLSVGVTKSGAVDTPRNIYDTAWYNESSLPGQAGAMLIDGHVSSWTSHGVFYGIKTLVAGDTIQIQRGDGKLFNYKVVMTQVYKSNNVDMAAALMPIDPAKPGLNLITCTGDVIPGTNEFNERIMVFAEQV